jgi:hypothetical protein
MAAALGSTTRTAGQMRGVLARLAVAGSQIAAHTSATAPPGPGGSPTPAAGDIAGDSAGRAGDVLAAPGWTEPTILNGMTDGMLEEWARRDAAPPPDEILPCVGSSAPPRGCSGNCLTRSEQASTSCWRSCDAHGRTSTPRGPSTCTDGRDSPSPCCIPCRRPGATDERASDRGRYRRASRRL